MDVTSIVAALTGPTAGKPDPRGNGEASSAEAAAYYERLVAALRAAHEMPGAVDALYLARVSFYLGADGTLSDVRVVAGSGNADFDRSVLAAFLRVRSIGAAPAGVCGRREINFVVKE